MRSVESQESRNRLCCEVKCGGSWSLRFALSAVSRRVWPRNRNPAGEMVLDPGRHVHHGRRRRPAGRNAAHASRSARFTSTRFPVTQELYEKVMGVNPSKQKDPKQPGREDAVDRRRPLLQQCSELEGLTPCYDLDTWECNFDADGYRLPTEAEWEYACRAGSTGKYCFGDDESELPKYAWFKPHSQGKTQPVGQKLPNRWGLYDMHGNVWQWCNDWYGEAYYKESPPKTRAARPAGKMRVLRGGAWDCTAEKCRSAYRHKEFPVYSDACFGADSYGFRRARQGR